MRIFAPVGTSSAESRLDLPSARAMSSVPPPPGAWPSSRRLPQSDSSSRETVLVVDDDPNTCLTFAWALRRCGLSVQIAENGAHAIAALTTCRVDLALIDLRLPDIPGTDVVRMTRTAGRHFPFILISAFLTTPATVDAMRLGARDVWPKPVSIDDLCEGVCRTLGGGPRSNSEPLSELVQEGRTPASKDIPEAGSIGERWAMLVLKGCESGADLKTISAWARTVGMSYSCVREACDLLGFSPHDSRDLTRALSAVMKARFHRCSPEVFLDIHDARTMRAFCGRAGFAWPCESRRSVDELLDRQDFVPADHEAVQMLRRLIKSSELPKARRPR